ncbi:hypothetical protein BDZ89DRAFT_1129793 [Hymenopellis radicata]|nr:hypothetical protein BDZ89DRAFT_1129793 [Hymenopellis radicata]
MGSFGAFTNIHSRVFWFTNATRLAENFNHGSGYASEDDLELEGDEDELPTAERVEATNTLTTSANSTSSAPISFFQLSTANASPATPASCAPFNTGSGQKEKSLAESGSSVKGICAKRRSEARPVYFPDFDAANLPVNSSGWHAEVIQDMVACIGKGRGTLTFTEKQRHHKRGPFPALNVGVGFGGGRKVIYLSLRRQVVSWTLLKRRSFRRWSGFMHSVFQTYNEEMYREYAANKASLCASDGALKWNFDNSVFAALAVNFSDNIICEDHTDDSNKPDGWCGVTSMGSFDHRKGGQMVLWDL